jgi:hypothetical protein
MAPVRRRPLLLGAALTAALLVAGGIAWAAIPDGNLVNACATTGGPIRAADAAGSCDVGETALQLGGPTRGYAFSQPAPVTLGTTGVVVGSLGLAPGSYLVHAKVNVANLNFTAPGSTFVPCSLGYRVDGALSGLDQTWIVLMQAVTGTAASSASIGLQGAVTLPEKGTVEVTCASVPRTTGPATNVVARYRKLDAIQVDTLATG